ncbi:MAG: radical SAM protein [Chloroflexota bacterium]
MRILLASPESGVWNSRKHIHMGLAYLAGSLLAHGYEVDIWDAAVEQDIESLDQRLARDPYDVVGFSAPTPLIVNAWDAAKTAKKHGAVTILGGPHLTIMPHESMEKDQVDLVVRGEAERTIVEIVAALEKDRGQSAAPDKPRVFKSDHMGDIMGLSWRDEDGKVKHNIDRPLDDDIDAIPFPAHHLFKIEHYTNLNPLTDGLDPNARAFTIVTSRGCPYKCTFCSKPVTGDTWRPRTVESVIAEWRWLVEDLGATEIGVTDDIWNLDRKRAKAICRGLIENNLNNVPWVTIHGMKVNNTDGELFKLMKEAGCKRVGFGIENGDDHMLRRVIKKGQTVDMVRDAVRWAKEAKLQTMGFFIYGMPGETEESMEKTTQLAIELDPDLAHFMMAAPFPGTEMWDKLLMAGVVENGNWDDTTIQDDKAHFVYGDLEAEVIERKWHEAHRRFYLRPKRAMKIISRKDTWLRFPYYAKTAMNMMVGLGEREVAPT